MIDKPWRELARRRKQLGLTQAVAAQGMMSQSQYSLLEQGVIMPSARVIRDLAQRLGGDAGAWAASWAPHIEIVRQRRRLWRAFFYQNTQLLSELVAREQPGLELELACYAHWLGSAVIDAPLAFARQLDATRERLATTPGNYFPKRMQAQGDIRLWIVLAVVEAALCQRIQRVRAAAAWRLQAHTMLHQVPQYWQ